MDQEREIERFKDDWEINFPNKIIWRTKPGILIRVFEFFFPPKYPVIALYRFAQSHLGSEEGIVFSNFIERGKENEVAGVPSWFELAGDWKIPNEDIQLLRLGPLVRGKEILVPAFPLKEFFFT